ncbi:MAG: molybdenum cofactor biosynthesis protein MoaE [Pseudomonadota bacterium]
MAKPAPYIAARLTGEPIEAPVNKNAWAREVDAGAVVTFSGLVRATTKSGEPIDRLVLEVHPRMTQRSIEEITAQGGARFDVMAINVVHRHGVLIPGDLIVWVAVASAHRQSAFNCADYLMDRLKSEAVFWKREEGAFGRRWIEPTADDRARLDRWSDNLSFAPDAVS